MATGEQWGRQNRRQRRETARALANAIMRGDPATSDKWAKLFTFVGIALTIMSWGYFALAPEPNVVLGCTLIFIGFFFFALAFWDFVGWPLKKKLPLVLSVAVIVGTADYYWGRYVGRPSFVIMVPGVWVNSNAWDFIIGHKGPKTSRSVEILFTDEDRKREVLKNHGSLSPQDLDSYQRIFRYPEVNPNGRGHIFAQQFLWTPLTPDHEHYTMRIIDADKIVEEKLQIERVQDKWYYAIEVKDAEHNELLVSCKDPGFPPGGSRRPKKCFPDVTTSFD